MMQEGEALEQQQEELLAKLQHWQALKTAAGTFATEEIVNLLAHAIIGNPSGMIEGALFGGIAAIAAGYQAPKVLRSLRESLPHTEELEPLWLLTHREPGKRSLMDKLLDRQPPDEVLEDDDDEQDESDEREEVFDEEEEEVQEAYMLNLGITLRPHPNAVFSNRIAILGMPGAGKSNTVAVLAEELGQYDAPLIIFDQKPEYTKLCAYPYFIHAFRANASNVTPTGAFEFGERMMNERLQVALDLTSYDDDDKAAYVMIEIIRGVLAWEKQFEVGNRLPVTFFFEEADYWLPQAEQHAHVDRSKEKGGKSLFNKLQQTVFNLVHRGRSFGMGTVISTQRPANIDNRAFAVAEWKILLKANMPSDLKVYQGIGLDPDAAQVLGKGEAYIIGPDIKGVFQIRKRNSPDEASTPGLENLQRKRVVREQRAPLPDPTSNIRTLRPDQERIHTENDSRIRAYTDVAPGQFERGLSEEALVRYARNNGDTSALEEAVSTQNGAVSLPNGWTEKKLEMLPDFYAGFENLDKSLIALKLPTNKINRDFARAMLKNQGLWKEAK
jgi:Helicase HerA, central domain